MTEPQPRGQLVVAVTNLKSAYRALQELVVAKADGDKSAKAPATLSDNDRMQLTDLADEVDDVLRRVAALDQGALGDSGKRACGSRYDSSRGGGDREVR